MSKGDSGTSKVHWIVATPKSSRMEMGRDRNGLYSRTAKDSEGIHIHLGYHGSINQSCAFYTLQTSYTRPRLAELYIARIVCLHGVPKKTVSDRGTQFTSKFWEKLHESMDTKLNFSSVYHPQTDRVTE
jgi:hypothetical protein